MGLYEGGKGWVLEKKSGVLSDVDFSLNKCGVDGNKDRLRSLFNQVLKGFLSEISTKRCCIRPLPVLNASGRMIDLFKLFWAVRNIGGYDVVSRKNLWGVVAEECGVVFEERASLKLIYMKYLSELDRWLQKGLRESNMGNGGSRIVEMLELMSNMLKNGFGGLLDVVENGEKDGDKFDKTRKKIALGNTKSLLNYSSSICNNNHHNHDCANGNVSNDGQKDFIDDKNDAVKSSKKVAEKVNECVHNLSEVKICTEDRYLYSLDQNVDCLSDEKFINDSSGEFQISTKINGNAFHEKLCGHSAKDVSVFEDGVIDRERYSQKRKRESLPWSEMLSWLSYVAKHSDDPAIGIISERLKKKEHGNDQFWNQALLVRKLLQIKRVTADVEISNNQKYRMHPSMYEDNVPSQQSAEVSSSSQRSPLFRCHSCRCQNSAHEHKTLQRASGNGLRKPLHSNDTSGGHKIEKYWEKPSEMHVFVGRLFQAEVPKWNGLVVSASDSKWLGQRVWPAEDANVEAVVKLDYVGKGRPLGCDCSFPDSTECIRFHIAEKRLKLKRELNSVFYEWRFGHMGEEVSLSWMTEEEKKFKDMIKFYSTSTNKFWRIAPKFFPSKTREKLVKYYFNVFVLRRRSYQNRVTPKNLDSDDDEKDFGAVGACFGHKAICIADSSLPICSENKQCTDLE